MRHENGMKGLSPLIATVLLIAFVISIAGIILTWANTFAVEQTDLVGEQSDTQITCAYGNVKMKNAVFASDSSTLAGTIENNGQISIGDMSLGIVYQNATSETIGLCGAPGSAISCSNANLSLAIAGQTTFNVSVSGGNYQTVRLITNCTGVGFDLESSDIASQ